VGDCFIFCRAGFVLVLLNERPLFDSISESKADLRKKNGDFTDDSRGAAEPLSPGEEADEPPDDDEVTFHLPADEEDSIDGPFIPSALVDDPFAVSEKLMTFNLSLKQSVRIANNSTNQLYSLLFCVYHDCERLLNGHRMSVPFSIASQVARFANARFYDVVIKHQKFVGGFNLQEISETDA
jgi:hypothetical protein